MLRAADGGDGGRGQAGEAEAVLPRAEEGALTPVLLVGLASGVMALALAQGGLFEPLRARLTGWAGELAGCPLCLGAWLCAALWAVQGIPEGIAAPVAWGAAWAVSTATAYGLERLAE